MTDSFIVKVVVDPAVIEVELLLWEDGSPTSVVDIMVECVVVEVVVNKLLI